MQIDYYFDTNLGILIAENYQLNRYYSYPGEDKKINENNFTVNTTLFSINDNILVNSSKLYRYIPNIFDYYIEIIVTSAIIGVFAVLFYFIYSKKRKFIEQTNETNS